MATLAALATLIAHAIDSIQNWEASRAALPAGVALLLITLVLLFADPLVRRQVRHQPALLVPFGCGIAADWLVTQVLHHVVGAWFTTLGAWPIAGLTFSLSVATVLAMLIAVLISAWTTALVVAVARGERAADQLGPALRRAGQRYWQVLGANVFGHGIVLFGAAGMLAAAARSGVEPPLAVIACLFTLVWNVASAALLVHVVADDRSFAAATRTAFLSALTGWRTLAWPKLSQLAVLGTFVWLQTTDGRNHRFTWHLHMQWAGGHAHTSHWYSDYCKFVEASASPLLLTMLSAALTGVALANQIRAARLLPERH
ncbi:MAG: hypothetical protein IPK26_07795 [Planctomycetes bacterium]|nr:hypothetical protein [Planctomycetota bacterium]